MQQPIDCTLITRTIDNTGNYIAGITISIIFGLAILAVLIGFLYNRYCEQKDNFWQRMCKESEGEKREMDRQVADLERQIVALQVANNTAA